MQVKKQAKFQLKNRKQLTFGNLEKKITLLYGEGALDISRIYTTPARCQFEMKRGLKRKKLLVKTLNGREIHKVQSRIDNQKLYARDGIPAEKICQYVVGEMD